MIQHPLPVAQGHAFRPRATFDLESGSIQVTVHAFATPSRSTDVIARTMIFPVSGGSPAHSLQHYHSENFEIP
jgi:hypothetical protein